MRKAGDRERTARLDWLWARPELWRGLPSLDEDVTDAASAALDALVLEMIGAGLCSRDLSGNRRRLLAWGLRGMIGELRGRPSPRRQWAWR